MDFSLMIGTASVDITPAPGIQLGGDIGRYRPAELVLDPLYARALVFSDGSRKLCLLSLDMIALMPEWVQVIRQRAADEMGFDPAAVMVHALQSHSAPGLGHFGFTEWVRPHIPPELDWLRGGDDRYHAWAAERIVDAIRQANASLAPAAIGYASAIESRWAFNRRFIMRDGKVATHPATASPLIRYAEGPVDPEVGVLYFTGEDLRPRALLLHYTCHPTHGYPHRYVSADWPGMWVQEMQDAFGPGCHAQVINGCCGNIHHNNHLDPRQVDDFRLMGRDLAETARQALKDKIHFVDSPALDYRLKEIPLRMRPLTGEQLADAHRMLEQYPLPKWVEENQVDWDWMYALSRLEMQAQYEQNPVNDYEIQAFRIGEIAIVALPGEPFVEGQLKIKVKSPTFPTYLAHMSNGEAGYIPTAHGVAGGGYESRISMWSRFVPEALDTIADESIKLLAELYA